MSAAVDTGYSRSISLVRTTPVEAAEHLQLVSPREIIQEKSTHLCIPVCSKLTLKK